ncbi:MAG: DUF4143 domain-containing protein [Bacteroidota bacterium]|nr:DUF4143 domain-containing protein [Bacteroidota bacterium]
MRFKILRKTLKANFSHYDLLFIDEAHRIPKIGLNLKLLIDHLPEIRIITTGSSTISLEKKIGEPLTGRQIKRILYPISVLELFEQYGGMEVHQLLDDLLIYGSYPDVLLRDSRDEKIEYLHSIRDSYLLKDILELENIKYSSKLLKLLQLIAFQIGYEVSLNELAKKLQIAKQSVERYLNLLEKAFVIKKVGGFSKNLRTEITKTARYYFIDNGIRNSIINNFNPLTMRNDIDQLWENFLFSERLKTKEYLRIFSNDYFWRTYDGKEIDLIEERNGGLFAYEFKYGIAKSKGLKKWKETYPDSVFETISKENYLEFLFQ